MNRIMFLGTGGGGHTMFYQVKRTGGIYFELDAEKGPVKFILDPGPGSLVFAHALGLKPESWNGVVLSHLHADHATDANVLLDGIKDAFLVAEENCIRMDEKKPVDYPCVSMYHQKQIKELFPVKHGQIIKTHGIEFHATRTNHYAPALGFKIKSSKFTIGYAGDGSYLAGQEKFYDDCDVLILNIFYPKGMEARKGVHMGVDDAITLVKGIKNKPRLVIIQHLSLFMLRTNMFRQVKIIKDATKIDTIHAEDFMEINLDTLATKIHDVKIVVK